jgi:hypothetical protein
MPDQAVIPVPDGTAIDQAAATWDEKANALQVCDQQTYELAGTLLSSIQTLRREIKDTFAKPKDLAHKAHKAICDAEKKHDSPLAAAEIRVKTKAGTWASEEKKRRERAELQRQAEERRKEEEERLEKARLLEEAGEQEQAEMVLEEEPPPPPPPKPSVTTPKSAHMSIKETWSAEVVNLRKLCEGIVEGTVPVSAVLPNMSLLNSTAKGLKEEFNWPGCRAVKSTGVAGRR